MGPHPACQLAESGKVGSVNSASVSGGQPDATPEVWSSALVEPVNTLGNDNDVRAVVEPYRTSNTLIPNAHSGAEPSLGPLRDYSTARKLKNP